jgi:hypothetical protein
MPTPKDNDAATEIALTLIATAPALALAVLMYALEPGLAARQSPRRKNSVNHGHRCERCNREVVIPMMTRIAVTKAKGKQAA